MFPSAHLVLNGDFLDFLRAPPWKNRRGLSALSPEGIPLSFTEQQSCQKLDAIIRAHSKGFRALAEFLAADDRRMLTILPGNHDADFFWPSIKQQFVQGVFPQKISGRVNFHCSQVLRPPGARDVWIEHGHQYDIVNAFYLDDHPCWSADAPPILSDKRGTQRLMECIGTRLVGQFVNHLQQDYPFISSIQPLSRLIHLVLLSALDLSGRHGPMKLLIASWRLLRYWATVRKQYPTDLLPLDDENIPPSGRILKECIRDLSERDRESLADEIRQGFPLPAPLSFYTSAEEEATKLLIFLSENLAILDNVISAPRAPDATSANSSPHQFLELRRRAAINEVDEQRSAALQILEANDVNSVIMGHTHVSVAPPDNTGYANTGCWVRFLSDECTLPQPTWTILQADSYEFFPYDLKYALVLPGEPSTVTLETYRKRGL